MSKKSTETQAAERYTRETIVRKGVTVTVTKWFGADGEPSGSTVEASCSCYGQPHRVHSLESCPNRAAK